MTARKNPYAYNATAKEVADALNISTDVVFDYDNQGIFREIEGMYCIEQCRWAYNHHQEFLKIFKQAHFNS